VFSLAPSDVLQLASKYWVNVEPLSFLE